MVKKLNLKTLSIIITLTAIIFISTLIKRRDILNLLEKPISAIGNLNQNYLLFLLGAGIVFYFIILFLIKIHTTQKIKISWELYALPILLILMFAFPYRDEFILAKILHTIAGVIAAVIMMYIIYKVNKYFFPENKFLRKINKNIPTITITGTLLLFFITGISTMMQLFYLIMGLLWINLTAFSKPITKEKNNKKINKNKKEK